MLTHAPWRALPGLRHGFLDRRVGEDGGGWAVAGPGGASLPVAVARQVHGTRVVAARPEGARPEADGLVPAAPGILVGVVTADCVPVLLIDPRQRAAAAVHAGWRGTAAGVLEATIECLTATCDSRPGDLEAAVGPAIGGCCYEVGPEVVDAFRARSGDLTAAWQHGAGRPHLDLRRVAQLLLRVAGVSAVTILGPCTACDRRYHSYRRDGATAGRQLSFVGWV